MLVEKLIEHGLPREYIEILREKGIRELNPVQSEAVLRGVLENKNMVVVAPTASGKTLIAEMALAKTALNNRIGVYLSPLRALASEKYDEFKRLKEIGLKIAISTGDFDQPAEYLGEHDIIIATYERFDSLMRLKPSWLNRVSLVVVDELHNINDPDRGPIIEIIIARCLKRGIRVLGLSATISNPEKLAEWIRGELVLSDWRPVRLVEGVFDKRKSKILFTDKRGEEVKREVGDNVLDLVLHNLEKDYQSLVFIHNRKRVEEYAIKTSRLLPRSSNPDLIKFVDQIEESPTRLERELISELMTHGVGFHHAGLSHVARTIVEEAFRKRVIKVIYATPTLAAGVNLPARRVLVSVKRYNPVEGRRANITVSEYKQMAGRAGRPQYDELGEAIIIDASSVEEGMRYIDSRPEPVEGNFYNDRSIRIHVLASIASEDANSVDQIIELFKSTFTAINSKLFNSLGEIHNTVELLKKLSMIEERKGILYPTRLGKITSYCYLDPLTVEIFIRFKQEKYSELYMLHLISMTPDFAKSAPYVPSRVQSRLEEIAEIYSNSNLLLPLNTSYFDYETWINGFIYSLVLYDWINERSEDEIYEKYGLGPGDVYNMRDTASWIASSLSKISGVIGDIQYHRRLLELSHRLEKGVKQDAIELASLRYIGRVRARILIENGIKTLEDLAKTPSRRLVNLPSFGPRIVEEIKRQLAEMGYEIVS